MSVNRYRIVTRCATGCKRRASHFGLWCDRCWRVFKDDVDFERMDVCLCSVMGCDTLIPYGQMFCQEHYGLYAPLLSPSLAVSDAS